MATSTKVLALAKANIKKTDGEKALDTVERAVKANQNAWRNEIFAAETAVDAAKDAIGGMHANVSTTAAQLLEANRILALAKKNLADMTDMQSARF